MIDAYCTYLNIVSCGITELNLTKFLHSVQKLLLTNLMKSTLQYFNLFWHANMPNEGVLSNCGGVATKNCNNFALKLVTMAISLEESEKEF